MRQDANANKNKNNTQTTNFDMCTSTPVCFNYSAAREGPIVEMR